MNETLLRNEEEAQRLINLPSSRTWKIVNPSEANAAGQSVGYTLVPGENSLPFSRPDALIRKRAGFVNAHVWVTPNDPAQMYAAGFYVNQSKGSDGLPAWTQAGRSIENRDIVLWYTMGITHIPRPEDWPVMMFRSVGLGAMFTRDAISPIEVVGCATFPQEPGQSDSTNRAFAAMRGAAR